MTRPEKRRTSPNRAGEDKVADSKRGEGGNSVKKWGFNSDNTSPERTVKVENIMATRGEDLSINDNLIIATLNLEGGGR